jgi:hypothetical protein
VRLGCPLIPLYYPELVHELVHGRIGVAGRTTQCEEGRRLKQARPPLLNLRKDCLRDARFLWLAPLAPSGSGKTVSRGASHCPTAVTPAADRWSPAPPDHRRVQGLAAGVLGLLILLFVDSRTPHLVRLYPIAYVDWSHFRESEAGPPNRMMSMTAVGRPRRKQSRPKGRSRVR